jgi:hypothetical protein
MRYNRRTVSTIDPPSQLPVTVPDMRAFLSLETSADDELLDAFIRASVDAIRQYLARSIVTETLELRMDGFPSYGDENLIRLGPGVHTAYYPALVNRGVEVDLPFGPVASIVSITTFDRANAPSVFDPANYRADASRVYLNEGRTWPTDLRDRDAVAIRYVSGSLDVPPAIVQAIKQHVAVMYECREGCELPDACKAMLRAYRRMDQLSW